ncbi:hypothetical protein BB559_000058 [Furculomyces boomerangus]|uniref:phosphoserine phosphatase n=2 Tax=Harpellales TaxID=61421 RepID=A0A2T9Z6F2_9FUNG|nr:hypothetical protein BB559_000058 [Furculomyces boomerangus]PVZ98946.1 hypothetical protein BB558_005033 [Smittium angustum]
MKFGEYFLQKSNVFPENWAQNLIAYKDLCLYLENNIWNNSVDLLRSLPREHKFIWDQSTNSPIQQTENQLQLTQSELSAFSNVKDVENSIIGTERSDFKNLFGKRLLSLSEKVPEFIELLDYSIEKMNNWSKAKAEELFTQINAFIKTIDENKKETNYEQEKTDNSLKISEINRLKSDLSKINLLEEFVVLNFTAIVKILKRFDKHSGLKIREPYIMRLNKLFAITNSDMLKTKEAVVQRLLRYPEYSKDFNNSHQTSKNIINDISLHSLAETKEGEIESIEPENSQSSTISVDEMRTNLMETLDPSSRPKSSSGSDRLQHVAISLRGPHGTDIIGGLLSCCDKYNCSILDFSFSRLHHNVVFGVLVEIPGALVDFFNSLAKTARRWDGIFTFDIQNSSLQAKQVVGGLEYKLVEAPYSGRNKFVATVLSQDGLNTAFLNTFVRWLLDRKISVEQMKRLDHSDKLKSIEYILSVPDDLDSNDLRKEIFQFSTEHHTDVALQLDNVFRRQKRLVVFDMDSTLIQQEVIDEIARFAGIVDQVSEITELAMRGQIEFKESLARRVLLLKGTPTSVLKKVQSKLTFMEGAHNLCKALKAAGFKLAVISGGFIPLAKFVKNELGLDYAFANQLETTPDGKYLTGRTTGPIVDADRKAELLDVIAQAEGIAIDQVIAVGDGANDLKMLARASLGIAFNAKPKVQAQARVRINQSSLINVLYLMGFSEKDADQLQGL